MKKEASSIKACLFFWFLPFLPKKGQHQGAAVKAFLFNHIENYEKIKIYMIIL